MDTPSQGGSSRSSWETLPTLHKGTQSPRTGVLVGKAGCAELWGPCFSVLAPWQPCQRTLSGDPLKIKEVLPTSPAGNTCLKSLCTP